MYLYMNLYLCLYCIFNLTNFRYKLYLENEDDEVGAVMETGSVEENDEDEENNVHHGKENQRPNNQIGRSESVKF